MSHAYSPGLKVLERTTIRRLRRLPLAGDVLVARGDRVTAEQIVMRTNLPGPADMVNVASILGTMPDETDKYLVVPQGTQLKKGALLAQRKSFFGLFTTRVEAPMDGMIEAVSKVTGQVTLRGPAVPVEVAAYIDGIVVATTAGESVEIETSGAFIQGIFGVGGETHGDLCMAVSSPGDTLTPALVTPAHAGKILVGGAFIAYDALRKAADTGVRAIITGGFDDADLKRLLGYDLGVAITGQENVGITLVVTEGFGTIKMAGKTFSLLAQLAGRKAAVNGATQIRAGVMRPEIVIPTEIAAAISDDSEAMVLKVGTAVRAIREPYFGKIGVVTAMPIELTVLRTKAMVRVLACRFEDGTEATVPRANVEVIATT